MRTELLETYHSKFDSPMAAYVYYRTTEGGLNGEDFASSDVGDGWAERFGNRIISEDSVGFVTWVRYDSVPEAEQAMAEYHQRWDDDSS